MEFAMHGSLKDYLTSMRSRKLIQPQLILQQQQQFGQSPPTGPLTTMSTSIPTCNGNALTGPSNQRYHLYPAAGAQAAEESSSLYDLDPASKAHAMRLLRLLNSKYWLEQGIDYYTKQQGKDSSFIETRKNNTPICSGGPPINANFREMKEDTVFCGVPQQECSLWPGQLSPNLTPYYNSNLSLPTNCICCCQHVDGEAIERDVCQQNGAVVGSKARLRGGGLNMITSTSCKDTETQLSYFEVLDFALQIARGMEHLETMKVNKANSS